MAPVYRTGAVQPSLLGDVRVELDDGREAGPARQSDLHKVVGEVVGHVKDFDLMMPDDVVVMVGVPVWLALEAHAVRLGDLRNDRTGKVQAVCLTGDSGSSLSHIAGGRWHRLDLAAFDVALEPAQAGCLAVVDNDQGGLEFQFHGVSP